MKEILVEDLNDVATRVCIPWEAMREKHVFVTGGTGLLGGLFIRAILQACELKKLNVKVTALVRDIEKAQAVLPPYVELLKGDVCAELTVNGPVDYVLHAACPTASKYFTEQPEETRRTIVEGTRNLLSFARDKNARMVYVSSMEVYGACARETVSEDDLGYLDPVLPRNSYPLGKRTAESLCLDAAAKGQNVVVARPVQTFGAGISPTENRVFAQFARAVLSGGEIVMKTTGSKAHCYCYTSDCIAGLLTLLLKGESGVVYNISNEETFCTIREMAESLVGPERVRIELDPGNYPPSTRMRISSDRLRALGWKPRYNLDEMYYRLMEWMKS